MTQLYWIRNSECKNIETDGYVGVSKDCQNRFRQHRRKNDRILPDAWVEIVFEGTREECFEKEYELRPTKAIGWNRAPGGAQGFKQGFIHTESTREKLRNAWTDERRKNASVWKAEQNKKLKGQKRPKQMVAMLGENNPMFDKTHSEATRKKIAEANFGRTSPNKQELYCIGCHQRASKHVLSRHQKCWKQYLSRNQDELTRLPISPQSFDPAVKARSSSCW